MAEITGYRNLSRNEVEDINQVKELAGKVGDLLIYLGQDGNLYDKRWLAIAKTDLQTGFMAAVRAIAQPTTF